MEIANIVKTTCLSASAVQGYSARNIEEADLTLGCWLWDPFLGKSKIGRRTEWKREDKGQFVVQEGNLSLLGYRAKHNKRWCNTGKL